MKKFIIIIAIGISFFIVSIKSYSQGVDDVLKLRAFKLLFLPTGKPWPEFKELKDCDLLIVIKVKNSMLNKVNIYSKEEQDYDIVYKTGEKTIDDRQLYYYTAIDNNGVKVAIQIGVTTSLPKLWDFTISYPTYDIYYLSK